MCVGEALRGQRDLGSTRGLLAVVAAGDRLVDDIEAEAPVIMSCAAARAALVDRPD
jgi:hypothetical protein